MQLNQQIHLCLQAVNQGLIKFKVLEPDLFLVF